MLCLRSSLTIVSLYSDCHSEPLECIRPGCVYTADLPEFGPQPNDEICADIIQEYGVSPFEIPQAELETILYKYECLYKPSTKTIAGHLSSMDTAMPRDLTLSDSLCEEIPFHYNSSDAAEIAPLNGNNLRSQGTPRFGETTGREIQQALKRGPTEVTLEENPRSRRRIPAAKWEEMRDIIKTAYSRNGNTLKETREILENDFAFVSS